MFLNLRNTSHDCHKTVMESGREELKRNKNQELRDLSVWLLLFTELLNSKAKNTILHKKSILSIEHEKIQVKVFKKILKRKESANNIYRKI